MKCSHGYSWIQLFFFFFLQSCLHPQPFSPSSPPLPSPPRSLSFEPHPSPVQFTECRNAQLQSRARRRRCCAGLRGSGLGVHAGDCSSFPVWLRILWAKTFAVADQLCCSLPPNEQESEAAADALMRPRLHGRADSTRWRFPGFPGCRAHAAHANGGAGARRPDQ